MATWSLNLLLCAIFPTQPNNGTGMKPAFLHAPRHGSRVLQYQPYLRGFCSVCNKPVAVDSPTVQPQKLYKYNKCSTQPTNEGGPDSPEQLLTPDSDHKQIWLSILKDSTMEFCDGQITGIKRYGNRPVFPTAGSSLMRMAGKWRLLASGHPILERPRTDHTDNWLVLPVVYCTCASPDMLRTGFAIAKVSIGSD